MDSPMFPTLPTRPSNAHFRKTLRMGFQINHIGAHQGDDHRILIYSRIHHSPI